MPEPYRGYLYYDPETGEPVTAKEYHVYKFSDPAFQDASPYRTSPEFFADLQDRLRLGPTDLCSQPAGVDPSQRV